MSKAISPQATGLGARVADARKMAGLSQRECSSRCGISENALYRIEAGRCQMRMSTLRKIADGLGASMTWLVEGIGSSGVGDTSLADPSLARRIFIARLRAGISQEELSRRTGVSRSSISALETERRTPHHMTLQKLADALGVSTHWTSEEGEDAPLAQRDTRGDALCHRFNRLPPRSQEAVLAIIVALEGNSFRREDGSLR